MFMGFDMGSFLVVHILDNHNHEMNSQVSKYRGPKPYKVTIFKFELGVEEGWMIWRYKQDLHWMCIYTTCTYSWILGRWMRWFSYPGKIKHFQKCVDIKKNIKNAPIRHHLGHTCPTPLLFDVNKLHSTQIGYVS
jgi:hypothetical protein